MSQRQSKIDSIVRLIEHPGTPYREREAAEAAYYRITKTAYVPNRPAPAQPQRQSFWSRSKPKEETPAPKRSSQPKRCETPFSDSVRKANEERQRRENNHAHEYQSTGETGSGGVYSSYGQSDIWAEQVSYDAQSMYESEHR